jgi:hypothetical protein
MPPGVVDQVVYDALELDLRHGHRPGVHPPDLHARGFVSRERGENGRRLCRWMGWRCLPGVEPCEDQQVIDERGEPFQLQCEIGAIFLGGPVASGHVDLYAQRGERAPELVRDVRDERALAVASGGEPVEHRVQRDGECPDLVTRGRLGESLVVARPRDTVRGRSQLVDRPERRADHAIGDQTQHDQQQGIGDQQRVHQTVLAPREIGHRFCHDDDRSPGPAGDGSDRDAQRRRDAEARSGHGDR